MAENGGFKFACPHCGQHFEAGADMFGMPFDCPSCGRACKVPEAGEMSRESNPLGENIESSSSQRPNDKAEPRRSVRPVITVIKRRERFADKCKKVLKVAGIVAVILFLAWGISLEETQPQDGSGGGAQSAQSRTASKAVASSIECLMNYMELPTERRMRVLQDSLGSCPDDFQDAMKGFLRAIAKTKEDMIPAKEREEMAAGKVVLGLLFGAINQDDPQRGVSAGFQLGDLIRAKTEETAAQRLKQEIESSIARLVDVAQKYGVNPNALEKALLSR